MIRIPTEDDPVEIIHGDCLDVLRALPDGCVNCCVTSPPYWGLRDYGVPGQLGLEPTPEEYVAKMVEVFREVRRVLRDDGTLWLNLGDSYQNAKGQAGGVDPKQPARRHGLRPNDSAIDGLKPKDLVGIPWRVAFALQADGWYLRQDIIWAKPNPMPESVRDRCTKAHEYVFLLAKSARYYYDAEEIKEKASSQFGSGIVERSQKYGDHIEISRPHSGWMGGDGDTRNRRSVWTINPQPFPGAHFATMPPKLVEPCILAGCPDGGIVLDPFSGAGTVAMVAAQNGRRAIGIELNPEYIEISQRRLDPVLCRQPGSLFAAIPPEKP